MRFADVAALGLVVLSLAIAGAVLSARKVPWNDEIMTLRMISDPSYLHMISSIVDGVDSSPPLYHTLARLWTRLFGAGFDSLRAFSAAGFCAAAIVFWRTLRHAYSVRATAASMAAVLCTSQLILTQLAEARYYGLLMAMVAVALWLYARTSADELPSRRLVLATGLAHCALVYTHIFGVLYSGALFAAMLSSDVRRRRPRWSLYLSVLAAWMTFAFWIPASLNHADMGKPRPWLPKPHLFEVLGSYSFASVLLVPALLAIAAMVSVEGFLPRAPGKSRGRAAAHLRADLVMAGIALVLLPFGAYVLSHVMHPIFMPRYVLPTALGVMLLLCNLVDSALGNTSGLYLVESARTRFATTLWAVFFCVLVGYPVYFATRVPQRPPPGGDLPALGLRGMPVVVEQQVPFMELRHLSPDSTAFFYILDEEVALDPANAIPAAGEYKLMLRWRRAGYVTNLVESPEILCRESRFAVLHGDGYKWFEQRVVSDSAFDVRKLGTLTRGLTFPVTAYLVTRRGTPRLCAASPTADAISREDTYRLTNR